MRKSITAESGVDVGGPARISPCCPADKRSVVLLLLLLLGDDEGNMDGVGLTQSPYDDDSGGKRPPPLG